MQDINAEFIEHEMEHDPDDELPLVGLGQRKASPAGLHKGAAGEEAPGREPEGEGAGDLGGRCSQMANKWSPARLPGPATPSRSPTGAGAEPSTRTS